MYPDLPHAAMRLLVYMALSTLDEPGEDGRPARVSWLGREALAGALGFDVPAEPEPWQDGPEADRVRAVRHSAFTMLKRQIKVLTDAGAIERARAGGRNRTAEYVLNVNPLDSQGQRSVAPVGQRIVAPKRQRFVAPEEDRGTTEENREENHGSGGSPRLARSAAVENPEDVAARQTLAALGPERQGALLEAAAAEGHTLTADLIRRAAQLAGPRPLAVAR